MQNFVGEKEELIKASLSGGFMESFMILNIINFADVARREKDESFMGCEESFITMKLIWHS